MDMAALQALFDKEQRRDVEFPHTKKYTLPLVTRFVSAPGEMSFVLYSRLDESNADEAIRQEIAFFSEIGQMFEWKVYEHDSPPDLRDRLVAHGFEAEEPEAVMVLDVQAAPASLLAAVTADVRRITTREGLADVIAVEEQVWGGNFDWIYKRLGNNLDIPGYLSVYVAYVDGAPACTGWTYFDKGSQFASLWGGSTVEAYRSRGLYTAVLATRVQEAAARGVRYLWIDTTPMSRAIVARHGFQVLSHAVACEWHPPEEATAGEESEAAAG